MVIVTSSDGQRHLTVGSRITRCVFYIAQFTLEIKNTQNFYPVKLVPSADGLKLLVFAQLDVLLNLVVAGRPVGVLRGVGQKSHECDSCDEECF